MPWALSEIAPAVRERAREAKVIDLKTTENDGQPVSIPAGTLGWVRLTWKGQDASDKQLPMTMRLWTSRTGSNSQADVTLMAAIFPRHPLRVADNDLRGKVLGGEDGLSPTDDQPYTDKIIGWSPTLDHPVVTREVVGGVGNTHADPFTLGAVEFLNPDQCAALANEVKDVVRSAFRIPVIIRAKGEDGKTPIDYGRFRRRVRLNVEGGSKDDVVEVVLEGRINGPLEVVRGTDLVDYVDFRTFNRSAPSETKEFKVRSLDDTKLILAVDEQRTAKFLEVTLEEPMQEGPSRLWTLKVRVKPNSVQGHFPDEKDPNYRDCAIYLRSGDDPRRYRLPVAGTAQSVGGQKSEVRSQKSDVRVRSI